MHETFTGTQGDRLEVAFFPESRVAEFHVSEHPTKPGHCTYQSPENVLELYRMLGEVLKERGMISGQTRDE